MYATQTSGAFLAILRQTLFVVYKNAPMIKHWGCVIGQNELKQKWGVGDFKNPHDFLQNNRIAVPGDLGHCPRISSVLEVKSTYA